MKSKLVISNRLVGREAEVERLQEIYRAIPTTKRKKVKRPSVYVTGLSGTGKSALIREALEALVEGEGGFFCQGKFDQMSSHRPFSAVVDAVNILCAKVVKSGQTVSSKQLKSILKYDEAILTGLLPNLAPLLRMNEGDKDEKTIQSAQSAARSHQALKYASFRLKKTLRGLLEALVGTAGLVLFIDDLQWASEESLDLIQYLVEEIKSTKLLFVGAYRSDQLKHNPRLTSQISGAPIIYISDLSLDEITIFISNTFHLNKKEAVPLAELVYEKTRGNILFARQYIDFLYRNGHIYYCIRSLRWKWEDLATIQDVFAVEGDIREIVAKKILRLPDETVEALKLACCIGARFEIDVIDHITREWWLSFEDDVVIPEDHSISQILWHAVEQELLEELSNDPLSSSIEYKFAHDRVQSVAYSLIGEERDLCHLTVGRGLGEMYKSENGQPWMLILAADHLFRGAALLQTDEERDEVALINYLAAIDLKENSSFLSSTAYLRHAADLVGKSGWRRCYQLCLDIHNLSAEVEFAVGNQKECEDRVKSVVRFALTAADKQIAYDIWVSSLMAQRRHGEALRTGCLQLRKMRLSRIPPRVNMMHIMIEISKILPRVREKDDETLLKIPDTKNEKAAAYVRMLMSTSLVAYFSNQVHDFVFFSLRALKISLKYGYTRYTPPSFAICGTIFGNMKNHQEAYRLGRIAMQLSDRFEATDVGVLTSYFYHSAIHHLYNRRNVFADQYFQLYNLGMNSGNIPMACISGATGLTVAWFDGSIRLDKLITIATQYRDEQIAFQKETLLPNTRLIRQLGLNMMGRSRIPSKLEGQEIKDLDAFIKHNRRDPSIKRNVQWVSLQLSYLFGDLDRAMRHAERNAKVWHLDFPMYSSLFMPFYRGMTWCALYERDGLSSFKRKAKRELAIFQYWEREGLASHKMLHKLLEAEVNALVDKKPPHDVKRDYDEAISVALEVGCHHLAALGAERAGTFFHDINEAFAAPYIKAALSGYRKWRAIGKVQDIKSRFYMYLEESKSDSVSISSNASKSSMNCTSKSS